MTTAEQKREKYLERQRRYEASEKGKARKRRCNRNAVASGANAAYKADQYARAKADGICASCCKRPARAGLTTCETCSARAAETQALTRYYGLPASEARELGLTRNVSAWKQS
jgi:hypothetical protein